MEKLNDIIEEAKRSNDPFWKEFRRQLDDPVYPSSAATHRKGTPIGIWTDKNARFLRLDAFMVTGLVQVSVRAIRDVWLKIRFGEDCLSVKFLEHPAWISKTAYREKPLLESSKVIQ